METVTPMTQVTTTTPVKHIPPVVFGLSAAAAAFFLSDNSKYKWLWVGLSGATVWFASEQIQNKIGI